MERLVLLVELGRVLGASLDHEVAARSALGVIVPAFADHGSIVVFDDRGVASCIAHAGETPLFPWSPRVAELAGEVFRTGSARLSAREGPDDVTVLLVPLVARGKPFGVMPLARDGRASRRFDAESDPPFAEELGRRVGFAVANARHHTERLVSEAALKASAETLRAIISTAADAVITTDSEHRITIFNRGAERIFGYAASEVLGEHFEILVPARFRLAHRAHVLAFASGATSAREMAERTPVFGLRKNGEELLAEFGAALMVATTDYEATLGELARLGVSELADWFIIDVVENGEIRRLNVASSDPAKAALRRAFARTPQERRSPQPIFEAIQGRKVTLVTEVTREYLESLEQDPAQLALLYALDIQSLITVPLIARGRVLGAFALVSSRATRRYDQRDLRFAEELARIAAVALDNAQLIQSTKRAVAARDEVLGVVAHDLRNPLNAVLMQAQLLQVRSPGAEARRPRPVDAIVRSAQRMDRLIQDLLDVTQLDGGSLKCETAPVLARRLLDEAFDTQREAASEAGLHLRLDAPDALPGVLADRGRLLQVFDNLIGNALKFTSQGGTVTVGAVPSAGELVFRISDTGPGIPKEHLPRLFERFWQATKGDRRGAGLGLPIVKGIVEAHRGRIWVESEIGVGTAFYLAIPTIAEVP